MSVVVCMCCLGFLCRNLVAVTFVY